MQKRTAERVRKEYGEKYRPAIGCPDLQTAARAVFDSMVQIGKGSVRDQKLQLWTEHGTIPGDWDDYRRLKRARLRDVLSSVSPILVCELGCGIGDNLTILPDVEAYGGELTAEGVEVARQHNLDVSRFNFYDPSDYSIIRSGSTVFTCHAVEQLPNARPVLEGLRSVRQQVKEVFHFEPLYGISLEQDKYLRKNDYCRNLLQLLQRASDVSIFYFQGRALGIHRLNVSGMIGWKFNRNAKV